MSTTPTSWSSKALTKVKPPLPFTPGKAAAGVVAAVGAHVVTLKPGDRVAVQVEYGAYAERLAVAAGHCYPLPDDIPFTDAAALGLTYQTAYFALTERAALRPGETVLVLGASGGVGVATLQLAKALGAGLSVAGVRGADPDNAAVARRAGADRIVNLSMDGLRDGLRATLRELTDGRGADVIIDPVGGEICTAALRALAWRGRLVVVGFAAGDIPTFKANYLLVKNIAVSGLQWSDYRDRDPAAVARAQAEIFSLYRAGKLQPIVSRIFPLEDFAQALAQLKRGDAQGKLVLTTGAQA